MSKRPSPAPSSSTEDEELWTVAEVAQYLRLTPKSVYAMVKGGRIPSMRIGNAIRFSPRALKAWLGTHIVVPPKSR